MPVTLLEAGLAAHQAQALGAGLIEQLLHRSLDRPLTEATMPAKDGPVLVPALQRSPQGTLVEVREARVRHTSHVDQLINAVLLQQCNECRPFLVGVPDAVDRAVRRGNFHYWTAP